MPHVGTRPCALRAGIDRLPSVARPAENIGPSSAPPQRTADPLRGLARRAAEGDGEAIHALVIELGGPMLRTVRKILGARHPDAEDVTQEAVLGLIAALGRFRGDCTVIHYAHQVALRSALHARRHFKVRDRVGDPRIEAEEPIDTSSRSPHEAAVSRQRRRIVRSLLERLPEPTAEALALHFMLGYTVEEIATIVEVSPNTIWSRLKLGKRALKQSLARDRQLAELLQGERS
jgi:RNA polymerase sigma factor (sigma-70 family)